MNRTIKLLMISDIFLVTGFGLIDPILAIFIKENLIGGSIFAAGFASTLFLVTKSIVQLPFSKYVDSHDDKVKWLIVGTFLISMVPFLYVFAKDIYLIYLAQVLYGVGAGFASPTWLGLWTTHLDKKHESFEWSIYSTSVGLGIAVTALIGATIAEYVDFSYSFVLTGIMALVGCTILLTLEKQEEEKRKLKSMETENYHSRRKLMHKKHH